MTYTPFQKARRIWAKGYNIPNMFLITETTIPLTGKEKLQLCISVDSDFALEINGVLAAFGQYTDYMANKVYEQRDLSSYIAAGENHFRLLLTSQNCDTSTDRMEQAGVQFEITDHTGHVLWATDEQTALFYTSRYHDRGVPLITGQLGFTFDCDLTAPACGERAKTTLLPDYPALFPRPVAALSLRERLSSTQVLRTSFADAADLPSDVSFGVRMQRAQFLAEGERGDGIALIFDLGAEQVGFPDISLTLEQDADILIGWGEHLADGRVRTDISGRCFAARCRMHAGTSQFLYPLRRLGLRYLQLHIYAQNVTVTYADIRPVEYPLPKARPFPGTDATHRAIYETCLRTLRLCMHDHYEDCPWREQALYTMDSRNQMLCGYAAFGETAMPRASLALIAQSLRKDHLLELCSPARVSITIPAFSAIFPVQAAEYLEFSGDADFLKELLPVLEDIIFGFDAKIEENGLLCCYPEPQYWNFYEWQSGLESSIGGAILPENMTYDAPLCCFVSLANTAMAAIYHTLGMEQKAHARLVRRDALNRAIHTHFYDPKSAVYDSYMRVNDKTRYHRCQLTLALAILCGACPEQEKERALTALWKDKSLLPVTLSHSIFRYEALLRHDRCDKNAIFDEIAHIWGGMLTQGATTFWETAEGESAFGNAGSLCHGWSAIPSYLYHRYGKNTKIKII